MGRAPGSSTVQASNRLVTADVAEALTAEVRRVTGRPDAEFLDLTDVGFVGSSLALTVDYTYTATRRQRRSTTFSYGLAGRYRDVPEPVRHLFRRALAHTRQLPLIDCHTAALYLLRSGTDLGDGARMLAEGAPEIDDRPASPGEDVALALIFDQVGAAVAAKPSPHAYVQIAKAIADLGGRDELLESAALAAA
jgi:hypothetical protein